MQGFRLAVLFAVCALAVACKGEARVTPVRLGVIPDFEPAVPTPPSDSVSLQESAVNGEHITLDVMVTDVSEPISGIALHLRFPGDIALFESCSINENVLPPGDCYVSQTPLHADEVLVGWTIVKPQQPISVAGSWTILRLKFLVFGVGTGSSGVVFESPNLGGSDASALLDANGDLIYVTWYGGTLSGS
jgi:hypothetical protein